MLTEGLSLDRCEAHAMTALDQDLLAFAGTRRFATLLADPPWQFINKTGKVAPEHKRLSRYGTLTLAEIMALPVEQLAAPTAHLYLWCPNALLPDGIAVMRAWGSGSRYVGTLLTPMAAACWLSLTSQTVPFF